MRKKRCKADMGAPSSSPLNFPSSSPGGAGAGTGMPRSSASSNGGAGVRNANSQLSSAMGMPSSGGRVAGLRRSETPLFFPAYVESHQYSLLLLYREV